ncbi:nucleotidyltransferase domain-containing protein [Spirosoma knui]
MEATYESKPLTADELKALSHEVKQALMELYGDRLAQVILYGSYARGDFHAESDVDYLVVLNDDKMEAGREIRKMASRIGALALKYGVELSIFPTTATKYEQGYTLFYQAVEQEGTRL